jgi:hypothetical protein
MRIRIVTFGLNIPAVAYTAHAVHLSPEFTGWPGLLGKWWLADPSSGTYGGVYLFASPHDADLSRDTDLFRGMVSDQALKDVTVREYDVLDEPTAVTAPAFSAPSASRQSAWSPPARVARADDSEPQAAPATVPTRGDHHPDHQPEETSA